MRVLLIIFLALLASCATTAPDWHPPLAAADTLRLPASAAPIGKVKARTIIYQVGTGNVASPADNRKAGQHQGSAATAPDATASNASKRTGGGVSPWWFVLAVVGGAVGWDMLSQQLGPLRWLPWRIKASS